MDVLQFLAQHRFVLYELRMAALLPELVVRAGFMGLLEKCQQAKQSFGMILFQIA